MHILDNFPEDWKEQIVPFLSPSIIQELNYQLKTAYDNTECYPPLNQLFTAFDLCNFSSCKVVILGQDPYHGPGQAHGLAFSVPEAISFPPSLRNMFKEYETDLGFQVPMSGNLTNWSKEGVLLMNTVFTVEKSRPNSHSDLGWQHISEAIIKALSHQKQAIAFVLWGKPAQQYSKLIDTNQHSIFSSAHPSPLSAYRGFFGSKVFSTVNKWLKEQNLSPINWEL